MPSKRNLRNIFGKHTKGIDDDTQDAGFYISFNVESDPCDPNPCQNDGICENGECTCRDRYRGEFCEIEKDFCELFQCVNGECYDSKCNCDPGMGSSSDLSNLVT